MDPRNPLARAEGIDEAADAPLTYLQHEMGAKPPTNGCRPSCVTGRKWWIFSSADGGEVSVGQRYAGLSRVAGRGERWAVGDRSALRWPPARRLAPPTAPAAGNHQPGRDGHRRRRGHGAFFNATRSPRSALYAARRLLRHGWQRLRAGRGQHLVNGNALVARLLRSALDAGVRFQLNAPAVRLLQGPQGVSGAMLRSDDGEMHVEAGAVVLACGGFPHDRQRLAQVVPHAAEGYGHFSAAPPDNQGEGIRLGESVGGQFDTRLRHPLAWAPVSRVTLASGQQLMFPIWWSEPSPG